jgi:hypothetical protein
MKMRFWLAITVITELTRATAIAQWTNPTSPGDTNPPANFYMEPPRTSGVSLTSNTNHAELGNLSYATAGHTGFQPAGDYATNSSLTNYMPLASWNTWLSTNTLVDATDPTYTQALAQASAAYGWGDHAGLYDLLGSAAAAPGTNGLQQVVNNGNGSTNVGTLAGIGDLSGSGRRAFGTGVSVQGIEASAAGASQSGYNNGTQTIGDNAYGASQSGWNEGTQTIGSGAWGAQMRGRVSVTDTATNNGIGAVQLLNLTTGQNALTTVDGDGSLLLGAGTVSNKYAIVAGDGQQSHGDGSITAGGGFYHGEVDVSAGAALGATAVQPATLTLHTTNNLNSHSVTLQQAAAAGATVVGVSVTFDAAGAGTNTFGGLKTILGATVFGAGGSSGSASGYNAVGLGAGCIASHDNAFAIGYGCTASEDASMALGYYSTALAPRSFAWNGTTNQNFQSSAQGYFEINPVDGFSGVKVGTTSLTDWLAALTTQLNMLSDSVGVQFGAANDAKIWFDGDSLNIKPNQITASDIVEVQGTMNVTNRLGIGQGSPAVRLEVLSTTDQFRLGYDANNWHTWNQGAFPVGLTLKPKANCTQSYRYQDKDGNTLLNIDSSNRRGGINTTGPDRAWEVNSTNGHCLRLTYNDADGTAANYVDFTVSSGGNLTITASSGAITLGTNVTVNGQIRGNHYTSATNQLANGTYTIYDGSGAGLTDGTITITDGLVTGYATGGQIIP